MAFVNEYITPEDRERYQLEAFEKRLQLINPQRDWAIDRERDIYLRVINPAARKSEPGDPDACREKDYHFHWQGYDYLVCTRGGLSDKELREWSGEMFGPKESPDPNSRVFRFYVLHIGEWCPPGMQSALKTRRSEAIEAFREVLAYGWTGLFARLTREEEQEPRYAILKIAPNAEVTA